MVHSRNLVSLLFASLFASTCLIGRIAAILNGDEARPGQFPYAVAIFGASSGFACVGTIIGNKWILSVAQSFTYPEENHPFEEDGFYIIFGTNDFEASDTSEIEINVEAIYIPREYKLAIRRDDIAVLKLAQSLEFERYGLQQLSMPTDCQNCYDVGTQALVTGFGAKDVEFIVNGTEKHMTSYDNDAKLRYANVQIVSNSEFAKIPHVHFDLRENHFLAKMMKESNSRYGLCFGDGGSPVVYQSKTIIGVAIETFDMCDEREYPSLYTKVGHYLDFIQNAMKDVVTEDIRVIRYQL